MTERYVHGHSPNVLAAHGSRTAENSCAYFLDRLDASMSLLDIGCGPGSITADLARLVGRVVGVDAAPAAISAARQRYNQPNLQFQVADVYALPYPDDAFDVVHAHQVLQHLADPVAALKEMARVARRFVAVRDADYGAMTWAPAGLEEWRDIYREIAYDGGGEPDAGRHLFEWALAAELQDSRVTSSTWTFSTPDEISWWSRSWASRVNEPAFLAQAEAIGRDGTGLAEAWRQWGSDPGAWFVVPHGELIAVLD